MADFNLAVVQADHQTAKFNSPPNFLAIQYALNINKHVRLLTRLYSSLLSFLFLWEEKANASLTPTYPSSSHAVVLIA